MAAAPSTSASTSSSSSSSGWSHDVFLSFRGIDTRNSFTSHLYNALDGAGINTFRDDVKLRTGEEIGPELLSAIELSRISIPIFSKNYAFSKWCLKELVKIVECRETTNQLVLPIFYNVDPSDVRNHTGSYAEAFQEHNKRFDEGTIGDWKKALRVVGELKGWDLNEIRDEGALIQLVVAEVSSKLRKDLQIVSDDLVGIQSHLEKMMSLLNINSEDVKIVGVWGLGGIGKTTIAKVVYNTISHHFEGCSFLANIRETSQHYRGLIDLQNQLVSNILKERSLNFTNVVEGINVIRSKLCRKKVLIILDDVEENSQLDAFVRKRDWFGLGSRIIITTRNQHILLNHGVDEIYEPSEMDTNQSLQLFSRRAFKRDQIVEDYQDLLKGIVKKIGGLPLALEVIGSSLFGKRKPAWQDTLKMLQDDFLPHDDIRKKLKISFDGLTYWEKEIFLDISCFFNGMDKNIACFIWQQCNFFPELGIDVLCQKSLVKIGENNELKMHDLLRDLGKEIIRQGKVPRKLKVPGKRSRLWSHELALDVLKKRTGTDKVEGLCIDFGGTTESQCYLMSEGFTKMTKLRLLQVDYAHFAPDFVPSFSELIWLRWRGCPLEFTLTQFHPLNLVVLDLSYSLVTSNWMGWNYIKVAKNLKALNLTGCRYLLRIPELTNLRLEVLILEKCENLAVIDESINYLESLIILNMRGCSKLRDLPYGIGGLTCLKNLDLHQCEGLAKLPDSIGLLENLETFDASFCYIKDGGIPDEIGWLSSLKILKLGGNNFHSLPDTVSNLSSLQTLDLRFCNKLESLPAELPSSLKNLNAMRCSSLKSLPRLSNLTNLEVLCLDDCENLVEIPALLGLRNLERLNLDNCHSLAVIEGLEGLDSLDLLIMNCRSLRKIGKLSSLKKLKEFRLTDYPMLSEIEGLVGLDSLGLLAIKGCKSLRKIPKLSGLRKLRVLEMEDCEELLEIEGLEGLDSLELLMMKNCKSLRKIGKISGLKKLKELRLTGYPMLTEIEGLEGLNSLELLIIKDCFSLRKISKLSALKKLRTIDITNCGSLNWIMSFEDLKSLAKLSVRECNLITEIPDVNSLEFLDTLEIRECESMERLQDLSNLRNLKFLSISSCSKLKEIQGLDRLESLETLVIEMCKDMNKLPDLSNLRNLKYLCTFYCIQLKEIQGLDRLGSLEILDLSGCKFMERLPDLFNLRNLKSLSTFECDELKEIQGLDRLESLNWLDIRNCMSMKRLPDLSNLKNLKHLSMGNDHKLTNSQVLDNTRGYFNTMYSNLYHYYFDTYSLSNLRRPGVPVIEMGEDLIFERRALLRRRLRENQKEGRAFEDRTKDDDQGNREEGSEMGSAWKQRLVEPYLPRR